MRAQLVGEVVPDVEGAPCLGGHNRSGADGAASAPTPTVKMVDPELGISSDAVRRKCDRFTHPLLSLAIQQPLHPLGLR